MTTAVITGGASGIGAAVAELWVSRGGRVAILDRDSEGIEQSTSRLGDAAVGVVTDVTSTTAVKDALASVATAFDDRLDAVINCAGVAGAFSASEGDDEEWMRMIDIHLNGTMRVCRAAYPLLKQSENSAIVNISSISAAVAMPGRSSYSAAKAGIEGLTRVLAVEWSPGIRVNAIAPGFVKTPLSDAMAASGRMDPRPAIARTPLGRFALPDEIAKTAWFLATRESSFITGQVIRVDGGITIAGGYTSS